MILFSILTAALVFVALIFLLPPLLGKKARNKAVEKRANDARKALKNATDADRKRIAETLLASIEDEQETAAPPARFSAAIVGLAVPLLALGLYAWLGSPALIDGKPAPATASHEAGGMTMAEAIARLEERLAQNPDNAEGWYMLARSYVAQQQFAKAAKAMERVVAIEGENDPHMLLQYADALAMANGGRVAGKPEAIIHKALALKPDYPEALWLAGIAESQNDRIPQALGYWKKAVALLEDQPEAQAELKNQIALAESKLAPADGAQIASATIPGAAGNPTAANAPASISVTVSLAAEMTTKVTPGDAVFIYARAASGPPMPLAATRTTVGALPVTVTLDDSQAMMPQMKLSSFPQVVVGARISKSGQAIPQPGDLEGISQPLDVQTTPQIAITIDHVR